MVVIHGKTLSFDQMRSRPSQRLRGNTVVEEEKVKWEEAKERLIESAGRWYVEWFG